MEDETFEDEEETEETEEEEDNEPEDIEEDVGEKEEAEVSEEKEEVAFKREMHKAICADCGKECEVPFKPIEGRSVYCRDCYQKHRQQRRRF